MKLSSIILVALISVLLATSAIALVDAKVGYTKTLGELGDRYGGGLYVGLDVELPIPGPISVVASGAYGSLGEDSMFSELLFDYIEQEIGVIPPQLNEIGKVESAFIVAGLGVRYKFIDNLMVSVYAEPGVAYLRRDVSAGNVPLSVLATYIPEFYMPVEPDNGYAITFDVGTRLLNKVPVISLEIGSRFLYGPGMGKTSVDTFLEENLDTFDAPTADNLMFLMFYGGVAFF